MILTLPDINYLAVLASAAIIMAIGFAWYSRSVFGDAWLKTIGKSPEDMQKGQMAPVITAGFGAALIMSFMLAYLISHLGINSFLEGSFLGIVAWLGFIATTMLNNILYDGRPMLYFFINSGYYLVSLSLVGGLLAIWK